MTVPANADLDVIPAYAARYCVCDNHYELILLSTHKFSRACACAVRRKACSCMRCKRSANFVYHVSDAT